MYLSGARGVVGDTHAHTLIACLLNELTDKLGCGSPVSYRFVYVISADICGEADKGGLARQRQEFKTYRKSTAQVVT